MIKTLSLAVALMTVATIAAATAAPPTSAPEIDPASAMAGLTMLAGTLAVLRGRRAKK
jgi:hypothetical protein